MQRTKAFNFAERSAVVDLLPLILFWFTGVVLAYFTYLRSSAIFSALMRRTIFCSASIVHLILVIILPFVITLLISIFNKSIFLYLLCLMKSFQLSICALALYGAFGSAGWVAQIFLLFSDTLFSVTLLSLWMLLVFKKGNLPAKFFIATFLFGLVIVILDAYIISPMIMPLNI